jgi:hypothetical protein
MLCSNDLRRSKQSIPERIRTSNLRLRRRSQRDTIDLVGRRVTPLAAVFWSLVWATGRLLETWHILAGNGTLWTRYRAKCRATSECTLAFVDPEKGA